MGRITFVHNHERLPARGEAHQRYAGDDFSTLRLSLMADLAQLGALALARVSHPIAEAVAAEAVADLPRLRLVVGDEADGRDLEEPGPNE
jgi:hypothetical protein